MEFFRDFQNKITRTKNDSIAGNGNGRVEVIIFYFLNWVILDLPLKRRCLKEIAPSNHKNSALVV